MDPTTAEQQWLGSCKNQGVWEGNLARYDPDGNFISRQPTVLFLSPSGRSDEANMARGDPPSKLKFRLHRTTDETDRESTLVKQEDDFAKGSVFDPTSGNYSLGNPELNVTGNSYCEFGINCASAEGAIFGRRRLVALFSGEHLARLTLFRERPGMHAVDTPKPNVPEDVRDSDTVASAIQVNPAALCGTWRIESRVFEIVGGKLTSREATARESRALDGGGMTFERDGVHGSGQVSDDSRSMIVQIDGCADRRLLFIAGGVTVTYCLALPKGNEEFYVELAWLVEPGVRHVIARRYIGTTWVESRFSVEKRL